MSAGIILWVGLVAVTALFPKSWAKAQARRQDPEFTAWQGLTGRFEYVGWLGIALAGAWVVPAWLATHIGVAAFVLCSAQTVLAYQVMGWYKPWRKPTTRVSEPPLGVARFQGAAKETNHSTVGGDGLLNPQVLKPARKKDRKPRGGNR